MVISCWLLQSQWSNTIELCSKIIQIKHACYNRLGYFKQPTHFSQTLEHFANNKRVHRSIMWGNEEKNVEEVTLPNDEVLHINSDTERKQQETKIRGSCEANRIQQNFDRKSFFSMRPIIIAIAGADNQYIWSYSISNISKIRMRSRIDQR